MKKKPPLVFLVHGFRGHPREFDPLAGYLHSQGLDTHRVCLPEHGDTPGDLANTNCQAMLEQCMIDLELCAQEYDNIHLVGFSLGGALSTVLTRHNPDLIRSLTLVASPYKPVWNLEYGQYHMRHFFNRFLPGILQSEWDTGFPKPMFSPVYLPRLYQEMDTFFSEVQLSARKMQTPTLLIHSPYDLTVPYEHSEWYFEMIPGEANFVTILRGGHQVFPFHVKGVVEQSILHHIQIHRDESLRLIVDKVS
jgi:esterase/lipase